MESQRIALIEAQSNESQAENMARNFLNTLAKKLNSKASIDDKVRSFIGNLKDRCR